MAKRYDYAVFIGRFQPFHIGHLFVFKEALKSAEHLIVLVGSAGGPRTLRNPFTFAERVKMITQSLPQELAHRIHLLPLEDYIYDDDAWVNAVTNVADDYIRSHHTLPCPHVALVGHDKDETTYYLQLFPNWAYIEVGNLDNLNATRVRRRYFTDGNPAIFSSDILPKATQTWLRAFSQNEAFIELSREYQSTQKFKKQWQHTPYPVIFTTTDALVRYGDEILLITRKNYPGKGLFALPGGFLDKDETLFDGCLRELAEETHLAVSREDLSRFLVEHRVFDDPKRSTRGRVITYCYYFDCSALTEKPAVQADDDAADYRWLPLSALDKQDFFEDHYFIINCFLPQITQLTATRSQK